MKAALVDCAINGLFRAHQFVFLRADEGSLLSRRRCLEVSALAGCSMLLGRRVRAAESPYQLIIVSRDDRSPGNGKLRCCSKAVAKAPRRRDFRTVPMILDTADLWDAQPLDAVIAYRGSMKQLWTIPRLAAPGST